MNNKIPSKSLFDDRLGCTPEGLEISRKIEEFVKTLLDDCAERGLSVRDAGILISTVSHTEISRAILKLRKKHEVY